MFFVIVPWYNDVIFSRMLYCLVALHPWCHNVIFLWNNILLLYHYVISRGVTMSFYYCITMLFCYDIVMLFLVVSLCRSFIVSQCYFVVVSMLFLMVSQCHFLIVSVYHFVMVSSYHFVMTSQCCFVIVSQCQFVMTSYYLFVMISKCGIVIVSQCHFVMLSQCQFEIVSMCDVVVASSNCAAHLRGSLWDGVVFAAYQVTVVVCVACCAGHQSGTRPVPAVSRGGSRPVGLRQNQSPRAISRTTGQASPQRSPH